LVVPDRGVPARGGVGSFKIGTGEGKNDEIDVAELRLSIDGMLDLTFAKRCEDERRSEPKNACTVVESTGETAVISDDSTASMLATRASRP